MIHRLLRIHMSCEAAPNQRYSQAKVHKQGRHSRSKTKFAFDALAPLSGKTQLVWSRDYHYPVCRLDIRGEHGHDQDWISCWILAIFRIRIEFGYSFLKKIGSGQDQDIGLISITKFSWVWFKMSQMMVAVFSLLCFFYIVSMCCTHHNQW